MVISGDHIRGRWTSTIGQGMVTSSGKVVWCDRAGDSARKVG